MRDFCWACHRPQTICFCSIARPFESDARFALIVHPFEVSSTVGTAWIIRRSMSNVHWFRSTGTDLDTDPRFLNLVSDSKRDSQRDPLTTPILLFPGPSALNLTHCKQSDWDSLLNSTAATSVDASAAQTTPKRPLFFVIDGTWTQARAMVRKSALLQSLPRVSFTTLRLSEYGFKKQPKPEYLSSVEGIHHVIDLLADRNWCARPADRSHDRMIEIFRKMVAHQEEREKFPRSLHLPPKRRAP